MSQVDHKQDVIQTQEKERAKQLSELIEIAQSRPGVKMFMEVYGQWRTVNDAIQPYRDVMEPKSVITTTNRSGAVA